MFFRCKGKVERWDAMHGTMADLPILRQTPEGTWIRYTGEPSESALIVFSPGNPTYVAPSAQKEADVKRVIALDGEWETEIVPTMDNKWGDFRLPATQELIGPEAREFQCRFVPSEEKGEDTPSSWQGIPEEIYGYIGITAAVYFTSIHYRF